MDLNDRFRGCLLGLAVGDAVGTTVEFKPRGTFPPVMDMVGGGPFHLNRGEWTDDTSMALCLAASLLERNGFDAKDQMDRYWKWYTQGYMSSNGRCFDIGNTTRISLKSYMSTGDPFSGPTGPYTAGNGAIMRLAPVVLFYYPDENLIHTYTVLSSRTTHGAIECVEACQLLGSILFRALCGADKKEVLFGNYPLPFTSNGIQHIAAGSYFIKGESEIQGSGYVVKSLEAALWSFWTTSSFKEAILAATNLGDDTDTTAAICGQVAGAYYGVNGIPFPWLYHLAMREEITAMANRFYLRQAAV
jgi:ADP-ribosyl-[dinitrogen reductase] hydrolase